jgi:RNA polymerase sigma factor (sigma-70 family)
VDDAEVFPMSTTVANYEQSDTCQRIVDLIQAGKAEGEELLYNTFSRGMKFLAVRHNAEYAEDCVHDAILAVSRQIRQGQLKIAAALPGYLNTVLKRTAWNKRVETERLNANDEVFATVVETRADDRSNPQQLLELKERSKILQDGLKSLKDHEREILKRFYLDGESIEHICEAMNLTPTQFRLSKSRSKQKLGEFTEKRLRLQASPKPPLRPTNHFYSLN